MTSSETILLRTCLPPLKEISIYPILLKLTYQKESISNMLPPSILMNTSPPSVLG